MSDAKKSASVEIKDGEDPTTLCKNYTNYCKQIGVTPNAGVVRTLQDQDPEKLPIEQIIASGEGEDADEFPQGRMRALMTALMGNGPGMKGGPYKLLKYLRIWKTCIGDEGAAAIAEVLRLGGAEVKLVYLELIETGIGPIGAHALGHSLSRWNNLSLLNLKIEFNPNFGSLGCINLCQGLRTNSTLKQLHLNYCGIDETAGAELANLLSNVRTSLEVLSLGGNSLRGRGIELLCVGLTNNAMCRKLVLSDNKIDQSAEDAAGLVALREALLSRFSVVSSVNLLYNRIGETGGKLLLPVRLENKNMAEFLVDASLPMPLFEKLFLKGVAGKKAKGGKKKKKKT